MKLFYFQSNDYEKKSTLFTENIINNNLKSTFHRKSWWKNKIEKNIELNNNVNNYSSLTCNFCCDLATKLLYNFKEKSQLFHPLNINENSNSHISKNYENSYHDDSKCYCS